MAERGANLLVRLRTFLHRRTVSLVRLYYNRIWGTKIGEGTRIARSVKIDLTNPGGVVIGRHSAVSFDAVILTHDFVNRRHVTTRVGDYCFIGARAILMPGVTIGDHCIVASGCIVMKDVPAGSVVIGNPGRVMERGIMTGEFGHRIPAPAARVAPPSPHGVVPA